MPINGPGHMRWALFYERMMQPAPTGFLTTMTIETLIENFELLGDWEDRYAYVMELGQTGCDGRGRQD